MSLRRLPSVEQLLQTQSAAVFIANYGRPITLQALRFVLDGIRIRSSQVEEVIVPTQDEIFVRVETTLLRWTSATMIPVINATGVILHTNLGRAPLSTSAINAIRDISSGYTNIEYDLVAGKRGSRQIHVEDILMRLTGAEAAIVVNNNASALLLVLSALANRKRVIISRSQMIEVGGGFRIPDVLRQSGAKLVEVGATNRVHLEDYQSALIDPAALVLFAHHSNYKMLGFTSEPDRMDIAKLAHQAGVLFVDDLGSGALLATENYGLAHEITVQDSLAAGSDLVCFSGDKLIGGPQAGIILGKAGLLAKIKKHPLARAVRSDKCCLAALAATLTHYLKNEAEREIPIWRMISTDQKGLKLRARSWAESLGQGEVIESESTVGGGSLPGETLPTWVLALRVKSPVKLLEKLRHTHPPVIARTSKELLFFDPRTVFPEQDATLIKAIMSSIQSS